MRRAIGGFDNHDGLIGSDATNRAHANRLAEVNSGLTFFWDALGDIGKRDSVTTFTASDFGRTYVSNGEGADHTVLGGSQLAGGRMAGTYPSVTPGGADDARENGWLIPATSVDT